MKLYHELAEYYFSIEDKHRDINEDVSLIRGLMEGRRDPSLLDIGCGTGEHLQRLNTAGFRCTGIDSSADMLRIARLRFPGAAEFIKEDMLSFDFYQEFDIAISLFGSFNYAINDNDVDRVFWNTWRALRTGGVGLFEIWNSVPVQRIHHKEPSLISVTNYSGVKIDRERGFTVLEYPGKTIVEVAYSYTIAHDGGTKTLRDRHVMRAFSREEIEGFILNNGFQVKAFYSNPLREPYSDTSNKILVHFEKP
jgi:SAM-dependent methyltransferase